MTLCIFLWEAAFPTVPGSWASPTGTAQTVQTDDNKDTIGSLQGQEKVSSGLSALVQCVASRMRPSSTASLDGRLEAGRPAPPPDDLAALRKSPLRTLRDSARTPRVDKAQGSVGPGVRWHLEGVSAIHTTPLH